MVMNLAEGRRSSLAKSARSTEAAPASISTLGGRLSSFRSLGHNCEFGFVQRYGGVEPSGLLRFSFTPIADLIQCLENNFVDFGAPGDLRLEIAESKTYYCASRKYNIWSNTAYTVGSISPDELLLREYGRIGHLKDRMLNDLALGSKILVRKSAEGEADADFAHLVKAVARHGPSPVLRVVEAGSSWQPGPVRQLHERVYLGQVRKFSPLETAWDVDLEPWIHLCDAAYATIFGYTEPVFYPDAKNDALFFASRLRHHRGKHQENVLNSYVRSVDASTFDPDIAYVFSSWVWIPSEAAPERIFAVAGHERLGCQDANLELRDCWQRVWAAGRFQHNVGPVAVGLGMIGNTRDTFWSKGARFYEGPVPRPCEPPAQLAHKLVRWVSRF